MCDMTHTHTHTHQDPKINTFWIRYLCVISWFSIFCIQAMHYNGKFPSVAHNT